MEKAFPQWKLFKRRSSRADAPGAIEHAARVLAELGGDLVARHRILGRTAIELFALFVHCPVIQSHLDDSLETLRAGEGRIGLVADALCAREDFGIAH